MNQDREKFTSEDLQKTMEVPVTGKNSPANDIFDPWHLNTDETSKETLDAIAEILAKSKKMPKEITIFSNGEEQSVKENRPPTYEEIFPEDSAIKQADFSAESTEISEEIEPEQTEENVLRETSEKQGEETDNIQAPEEPIIIEEESVVQFEQADIDATQVVPVISPSDVKNDKPQEEMIRKEEAGKGRLWPPVLASSLFLIVACFVTLFIGIMPVIMQMGFARGMTQIIAPVITAGQPPEKTNVLLMGLDEDGYRTDTMMVATYDNETGKVYIMQLPRDTYIPNNGRKDKKLNSAYFSGIDQLTKEIKMAYGIEIHRFVGVNLEGFRELVDAIGGVYMDVPINMIYDDDYQDFHIYILKGPQVLNGDKAEEFVRFRQNNDGSGYPLGDLQRMQAQKDFIMATVKQMISIESITKLDELINIAQEHVETDLAFDEIYNYAVAVLTSKDFNVEFVETPGRAVNYPDGSFFIVDYEGAVKVASEYFYATEEITAEMTVDNITEETIEMDDSYYYEEDEETISIWDEEEESDEPIEEEPGNEEEPSGEEEPEPEEEPVDESDEGSAMSR